MKWVLFKKRKRDDSVAADDPSGPHLNINREQLGMDYKATLQVKKEGQHADAVVALRKLRAQLPEQDGKEASGEERARQTWRDQAWARHLRYLCDLSLGESLRTLGEHAEALRFLFAALRFRESEEQQSSGGLHAEQQGNWLLWDAVADSAAEAEDWFALKISCEKCLQTWPRDPLKLRSLVRALLQLGLDRECMQPLEALQEVAHETGAEFFGQREAWLLSRLRSGSIAESMSAELVLTPEMETQFEADFDRLLEQRRKRLRTEAKPQPVQAKHMIVEELSLVPLLEDCRKMMLSGLPLLHPVIFIWEEVKAVSVEDAEEMSADSANDVCMEPHAVLASSSSRESMQGHEGGMSTNVTEPSMQNEQLPEAHSEMPERVAAASTAFWESLDPLLNNHGQERQQMGCIRWILSVLNDTALRPQTESMERRREPRMQAATEEARGIRHLLHASPRVSTSGHSSGSASPSRPFRSWLLRILVFALSQRRFFQDTDVVKRFALCVVQLTVSLCSPEALECLQAINPSSGSEPVQHWHCGGWLNDRFLNWIGFQEVSSSEAVYITEFAYQLRTFLVTYGMALAELCMDSHASWESASSMSIDFLQVWLQINPRIPANVKMWLVRLLSSSKNPEHEELGQKLPSEVLVHMESEPCLGEDIVRVCWCLSLQKEPAEANALLHLCREALGACQKEVKNQSGTCISIPACSKRIAAPDKSRAADTLLNDEVGQDQLLKDELVELCEDLMSRRLPDQKDPWPPKLNAQLEDLFRLTQRLLDENSTTSADNGNPESCSFAMLFQVFARIMSHLVVGFCSDNALGDHEIFRTEKLICVLRWSATLVEAAQRHNDFMTTYTGRTAPCFVGVTATDPASGVNANIHPAGGASMCLWAQPCEHMVLACLLLADQVAAGRLSLEFFPLAHASISLVMKLCGTLLFAAEASPRCRDSTRGGSMLQYHSSMIVGGGSSDEDAKGPRHVTPRALWLQLCHFLAAGQALAIALGFTFYEALQTSGAGERSAYARECSNKLFGESGTPGKRVTDTRLCTTFETPLSLPNIICTCALRIGCETLAVWRGVLTSWQECASSRHLPVLSDKVPDPEVEKTDAAQILAEAIQVESPRDTASSQRAIDQRPAWRKSLRALRGADGQAPTPLLNFQGDEEVDEATCKLLARALVCFSRLGEVDPMPPAQLPNNCLCRFLMDPAVSWNAEVVELSEAAKRLQEGSRDPLPLHVLLLAWEVGKKLVRAVEKLKLPRPQTNLRSHLTMHLDLLLFPEAFAEKDIESMPQAFFHPLLMSRNMLKGIHEVFKDDLHGQLTFVWCSPYTKMLRAFGKNQSAALAAGVTGGYPQELLAEGVPGLAEAFRRIDELVRELDENEWKYPPPDNNSKAKWLDDQDRKAGRNLLECISGVPTVAMPAGLRELYAKAVDVMNLKRPKTVQLSKDILPWIETISWASKDIMLQPKNWHTWAKIAGIFKVLCTTFDDMVAKREKWASNYQKWMMEERLCFHWPEHLQAVYSNARLLNLMLSECFEDQLLAGLSPSGDEEPAVSSAHSARSTTVSDTELESLANKWVQRQLDLLELYRCRQLSVPRESNKSVLAENVPPKKYLLVQRCDQIARRLLWFLVHCTDVGDLPQLADVADLIKMNATWPKPSFAQSWGMLEGRQRLLCFKQNKLQPPLLWNIPCLVASCQWKLQVLPWSDKIEPKHILTLLSAAKDIEVWARESSFSFAHDAKNAGEAAPCEQQYGPAWKYETMKWKMVQTLPLQELNFLEGSRFGLNTNQASPEKMKQTIMKDCATGLQLISKKKSYYEGPLILKKARAKIENTEPDYAGAAALVEGIFTIPQNFPEDGSKLGLKMMMPDSSDSRKEADISWHHSQRTRRYNWVRAKALIFIVGLHRKSVKAVISEKDEFIKPTLRSENAESEELIDLVTGLSEQRCAAWKHLLGTTGLLVMVIRGMGVPKDASLNELWTTFHEGFHHTLLFGIKKLLTERDRRFRPCFDWELLARLHSCFLAVRASEKDENIRRQFREMFVRAVLDVKRYVKQHIKLPQEFGVVKHEDELQEAEAFFQQLSLRMPEISGRWGSSRERSHARQSKTYSAGESVCEVVDSE